MSPNTIRPRARAQAARALAALFAGLSLSAAFAASGTWTNTAASDWFNPDNWDNGTIASGASFTATLNATTGSNVGINLDQDLILGRITFNAAGQTDGTGLNITSSGGHTLTLATNDATAPILDVRGTHTISAQILGTQGFNKTNAGKLTLSGNNLYSGVTTISNGNLTISSNNGLGATGAGNGTLVNFTSGQYPQLHFTNNVETSEDITLRMHMSNSTAGDSITSNLLYNDGGNTILNGTLTLERSTTGGINNIYGYGIQGSAGILTINGAVTGLLTGTQASGNYANPNQLQLRTRAATAAININGIISDGNIGTGGVAVYTATDNIGIVRLSAANTYSGATVHRSGTLLINNTTGSGTGTGSVSVASGAIFGGTGIVKPTGSNGVTFASGSTVAPGNLNDSGSAIAAGQSLTFDLSETTGNVTFESGAAIALNLNASIGTVAENLAFVGLVADQSNVTFNNNLVSFSLTGGLLSDGVYTIVSFDAANSYSGNLVLGGGLEGYSASLLHNADSIQLVIGAIPEPSTAAFAAGLVTLGAAGLVRRRRRS